MPLERRGPRDLPTQKLSAPPVPLERPGQKVHKGRRAHLDPWDQGVSTLLSLHRKASLWDDGWVYCKQVCTV